MAPFLDERGRRLFTASEARAAGRGGVTAVATATRVARSTIGRGLAEVRLGRGDLGSRIRRPGGGRKPAVETQPGLLEALSELVQSAIPAAIPRPPDCRKAGADPIKPTRFVDVANRRATATGRGGSVTENYNVIGDRPLSTSEFEPVNSADADRRG